MRVKTVIGLVVGCVLLSGCMTRQQSVVAAAPAATTAAAMPDMEMPVDSTSVAKFKQEAAARKLHFFIICNEDPDDDPFYGEAWSADSPHDSYNPKFIEEGGVPSWTVRGKSPDTVARLLYEAVRTREPDFIPKHKRVPEKGRQCPRPIRG